MAECGTRIGLPAKSGEGCTPRRAAACLAKPLDNGNRVLEEERQTAGASSCQEGPKRGCKFCNRQAKGGKVHLSEYPAFLVPRSDMVEL